MKHLTTLALISLISCSSPESSYTYESAETVQVPTAPAAPPFEFVRHSATSDEFAQYVHVEVKNTSGQLISYIELKGIWSDKAGNIVGTGIGNAVNLGVGQSKTIDVMGMDIQDAHTYHIEVTNFY